MIGGSTLRCAGCGAVPLASDPYGWACPNRERGDDVDHVMVRHIATERLVTSDSAQPFVRYRGMLHAYHQWRAAGRADAEFVEMVEGLDAAVVAVDGRGFRRTPFEHYAALDDAIGAQVWVKDETSNVGGSHKGRHLFGLLIIMEVASRLDLDVRSRRLAIASCGNAALAAAVIAAAVHRNLDVFVPPDADPSVLTRLRDLGASVTVCERATGVAGDPCYHQMRAAVAGGAVPFGCQGPDNGLTVEGGATLGWEIAEQLATCAATADRVVVQVGGGALASACFQGLTEAVACGVLAAAPRLHAVQTAGAYPLVRAYDALVADHVPLDDAARHRSKYMWPWESVPHSIATGILDDETYDWLAVVRGVIATGGGAVVVDDATLADANRLARETTGIDVDHTGSAGLAGVLQLPRSAGDIVVLFTG